MVTSVIGEKVLLWLHQFSGKKCVAMVTSVLVKMCSYG